MKNNLLFIAIAAFGIVACSGNESQRQEQVKFEQYMIAGKQLYMQNCSMCHQKNGEGLARLYPPLDKSDYMQNHLEEVICLIKYGTEAPLTVNGILYTQPMPGVRNITNLEIAEIATYIYNTGEHERGLISVKEVDKIISNCNN